MATDRRPAPFLSLSKFFSHPIWPNFGKGCSASRFLPFYVLYFIVGVSLGFIQQSLQDLKTVQVFNKKMLSFETTAANPTVGIFANY